MRNEHLLNEWSPLAHHIKEMTYFLTFYKIFEACWERVLNYPTWHEIQNAKYQHEQGTNMKPGSSNEILKIENYENRKIVVIINEVI